MLRRKLLLFGQQVAPEAQALFNAMIPPPSPQRRVLINNVIVALKNAGVWPLLDLLQVYAAANNQAALLNWITPGSGSATNSGCTFAADRGYSGDGISAFVETNFNPTTGPPRFVQDSASMAVWSLTQASSGSTAALGWAVTGTGGVYIIPRNATNLQGIANNNTTTFGTFANSDGRGLYAVNRSGAAGFDLYANGGFGSTTVAASVAPINHTFRVDNFAAGSFASTQAALGMAGQSLTAAQHLAVYQAFLPYMQAIGASS